MNKLLNRGQAFIGIIIVVIVVLLMGGGLFFYLNSQQRNVSQNSQQKNVTEELEKELPKEERQDEIPQNEEPTCQNDCLPVDSKKCSGNGYQTCGNYDSDNCLEWSPITVCSANTICQNGNCIQQKCTDGTPYGQCSTVKPKYCENGTSIDKASICGCLSGYKIIGDVCNIFKQSEVLSYVNEKTRVQEQYCSYDETRNKVSIIIKENSIYDNLEMTDIFNQYFNSVKNHLNIDNVGVKKFTGSTITEFDNFIEDLVKNEFVGYIIFVGDDLPILTPWEGKTLLDIDSINKNYSYVGRSQEMWVNQCIDVAISNIIPPLYFSNQDKISFVNQVFKNFISYHSNPQSTFNRFKNNILSIEDSEFAGMSINNNPSRFDNYNTIYFYNPIYILNNETSRVQTEMKNKPLVLTYSVHGSGDLLGLGLNGTYVNNNEILDFYNTNGQISLFVDPIIACGINVLKENESVTGFCCWPQTWLKTGVWVETVVFGDGDHYNFERWLSTEKVVGKALRKTWHSQDMIYGDILATFP